MDIKQVRIGVALSSGGARGFAHVGVLKALLEAGLDVVRVAGSSMGSIMAAGYAVRGDIAELEQRVLAFRARDHTRRGLPIMNPARITAFLDDVLGSASFTDCVVPLAIVATDLERRTTTTLTDGPVALATFASMAMPFVHRPVPWEGLAGRRLAELCAAAAPGAGDWGRSGDRLAGQQGAATHQWSHGGRRSERWPGDSRLAAFLR